MLTESLNIYVIDKNGNKVTFPNVGGMQPSIVDVNLNRERMAGAPTNTSTLMYPVCLDSYWTKKEFIEIGSERFYVKQVPTSEKNTEDARCKHEITFVSERDILENVFFFDCVTQDTSSQISDKPRTNTTEFSFYGDLNELVQRLNDSLSYSKIYDPKGENGFCIVIDDDVEIGEAKEVSMTDAYFATAMQEIYNVFEVPYYWVGKVCHVGYQENEITEPFEYGSGNGLISVQKTNAEFRLINRITGQGSADNIPYYYPNSDPNGTAIFETENFDKSLVSQISLAKVFQYTTDIYGLDIILCKNKQETYSANLLDFDNYLTKVKDAQFSDQRGEFTFDGVSIDIAPKVTDLTFRGFYGNYSYQRKASGGHGSNTTRRIGTTFMWCYLVYDMNAIGTKSKIDFSNIQFVAKINKAYKGNGSDSVTSTAIPDVSFSYDYAYYIGGLEVPMSKEDVMDKIKNSLDGKEWNSQMFFGASIDGMNSFTNSSSRDCEFVMSQKHSILIECCVTCDFKNAKDIVLDVSIEPQGELSFLYDAGEQMFIALPSGKTKPLSESGITITNTDNIPFANVDYKYDGENWLASDLISASSNAAKIKILGRDFINPISKLMPSIYRDSKGTERFYNAISNEYQIEGEQGKHIFNNPYLPNEPLEGKQDFEDIKPTINGITNEDGELFGEIAEVAFDDTDSDDLSVEDASDANTNTAKPVHPYFYVKLHKFSGENGFNLFKQGLAQGAMTFNFITGSCAGCSFKVKVSEGKQVDNHYEFQNHVQVDEQGNIVAGDSGDKIKASNPIASQQDTMTNSVWVALEKDNSTFGVLMPNATNNYRPQGKTELREGDKFVITNILLPTQYITAAEKRLEAALVKYMSENNDEKFTFSIKFSRIYLQEHPEIAEKINENTKLHVKYNNVDYPLFVSSYSRKSDDNILDEISVELSDKLTIAQNKSKEQMDSIMGNINSGITETVTISSAELLNQIQTLLGKKLSKTDNDTASGIITFLRGFNFANTLLTNIVKSTDWRKTMDDSQLVTGGGMARYVENILANLADKYLRRDIDDEAKGLITFLAGLKSDDLATFLSGIEVAGLAVFKNTLSSETFVSGWSGYGWRLLMKEVMNVIGSTVMKSELEVDELTVRGSLRAFEFIINQLRGENDNFVFAGMQKVQSVDADNKTIYLDTNKGETYCPFTEGDILRCQRFQTGGTIIKQYDIVVKEAHVGSLSDGENRIDSIVWEAFSGDINDIAQGDVLCRLDNDRDPERKGIITTTSVGSNSPYIDVIYGLITNPKESLKVRLGKLDGIVNELFGELSGYGLFSNNAFLTGEFYLSTGEAVSTKIKMLENLFSSSMSKTTYDIKEDDNIVTNCAFIDDMKGWTVVDGDDMDLFFIDDDTPVFMNDDMFSDGRSVASLENVQGKDMLHLLNAGVSQDNALFLGRVPADSEVEEYVRDSEGNIIKNDDGTLKTKTKTIRPTIYISYRYMCKESGVLNIGFNNGRTTQYSSDMGVIVSVDELGTLTESVNANEGVWIERQYKGYYDKLGDFSISTTGEVYIDVLAVTSKPLDDYKNVVSTALVQTAGAIGLYGKNIRANEESIHGVGQSVTELGVVVDANKREVDLFVNTTYANDKAGLETKIENGIKVSTEGIEAVSSRTTVLEKDTATLKINYNSISTEVSNAKGDITTLQQTADSITTRVGDAEGRISTIEQTASNISLVVEQTRTSTCDVIYNNNVTIKTDASDKTMAALSYTITPTFLIANEAQTITSLSVASGSGSGNPRLSISGKSVVVICDQGATLSSPKMLEAVASVTRSERQVDGTTKNVTYTRSMFITVSPAAKGDQGIQGIQGIQGVKGNTGAGEVYTLVDNGSYATLTAADSLTFYLAFVISKTVDGTSSNIDSSWYSNHKVQYKSDSAKISNWTDITLSSNSYAQTILNAIAFDASSYNTTDLFMVRLVETSSGAIMADFTVPLKLSKGAAISITDNRIKIQVLDSDKWAKIDTTANRIEAVVSDLKSKTGIDITNGKIEISSVDSGGKPTGNFIVNTGNFKVKSDGTIECSNGIFSGTVYASGGSFTGTVTATDGTFNGTVKANSGYFNNGEFNNCTIKDTCVIKGELQGVYGQFGAWEIGKQQYDLYCQKDFDVLFVMRNTKHNNARDVTIRTTTGLSTYYGDSSTDSVPMLSVKTDNGVCANFTVLYTGGTALSLSAPNGATAMSCSGDVVLSGLVRGLRLNATTMSSGGTISPSYDVICFNNTSAITVTLPSASTYKGRMLFLKKLGSGSVTLKGTIIPANGTGSTTTTESVGANKSMIYISNGSAWIEYYCG